MAAKEMISLRVWRDDLERWKMAAKREGVDRSTWMNKTLNEATTTTRPEEAAKTVGERESSNEPPSPIPQ